MDACCYINIRGNEVETKDIREIAKSLGIHPGNFSKTRLIKTIQSEEGNFDCYATAYDGVCD